MAMSGGKESAKKQAGGGQVLTLTPPPKIDLRDAHAIRREMGAVYRAARAGRVSTQDMTRFIYALDRIRQAYEISVIQAGLEQYEKIINQGKEGQQK